MANYSYSSGPSFFDLVNSGLKPRIRERRVARSGTVEAADAWSESATEVSATGLNKFSGCNKSELRMTPFCL